MSKTRLMKKLSSVILIMAMLVTMFATFGTTSVSAATLTTTTLYDWYAHKDGTPDGTFSKDTSVKHDGTASLNVTITSGTVLLTNNYANMELEKNTKYKFEFYAKKTTTGSINALFWDSVDTNNKQSNIFGSGFKSEEDADSGWIKYYRDITTGNNPIFYIKLSGAMNINLDDMALYKYDGTTPDTSNNLLRNGDFEATAATDYGTNPAIDGYTFDYRYGGKYIPNKMYAEANTDLSNVRTGNGSLKVVRTAYAERYPSAALLLKTTTTAPTNGSTYRLTYYVKNDGDITYKNGNPTAASQVAGISWNWGKVTKNLSHTTTPQFTETADSEHPGWTKMETDITTTSTAGTLEFRVIGHFVGYIDDVSIYKLEEGQPTGNNLVEYGTFDYVVPDPMEYEPKNVLMISGQADGGVLNISWRNPKKTTLNKVTLYKITSGAPEVVSSTLDTTPNASVEYLVGGLNATTQYTYKLTFDFTDGAKREVVMNAKPFAYNDKNTEYTGTKPFLLSADGYSTHGWRVVTPYGDYTGNKKSILPSNITIDTTEKKSGNASLHIQTNKDADAVRVEDGLTMNNYFLRLDNINVKKALTLGKTYRLKVWAKTKNYNRITGTSVGRAINLCGSAKELNGTGYGLDADGDWKQYSVDFEAASSLTHSLRINVPSDNIEDLWLDDFEIYELTTEDGGETYTEMGSNLFTDGAGNTTDYRPGFETYTEANPVTGQSATAGNRSVTINYTAPSDSKYVRIYEKGVHEGSEQWYLRAIAEPTATSVTLDGLTNGTTYNYKIESQSVYGVYSTPVTASATPVAPPYEVEGDYSLKLGSASETAITGNGTYTVSLDVTNYTTADFKPALIVALYKDDILVGYSKDDDYTFIKKDDGDNKTLSADVTVDNYDSDAKYEICAFFWNSFDKLSPLYKSMSWDNQ